MKSNFQKSTQGQRVLTRKSQQLFQSPQDWGQLYVFSMLQQKWHTNASKTAKMRKSQESLCLSWKQARAYFNWNCSHCTVGQELQLSKAHYIIKEPHKHSDKLTCSLRTQSVSKTLICDALWSFSVAVTSGAGAFFSRGGDCDVNTLKQGDHIPKWLGWGCNRLGGHRLPGQMSASEQRSWGAE